MLSSQKYVAKTEHFLCQIGPHDAGQRMVIALQDYKPDGDDDLPLHKDQEYNLINSSNSDWWTVEDDKG